MKELANWVHTGRQQRRFVFKSRVNGETMSRLSCVRLLSRCAVLIQGVRPAGRCLQLLIILFLSVVVTSTGVAGSTHRIQVRNVGGNAELYDHATGQSFLMRGNNYVRIADLRKKPENSLLAYHSVFNVGRYSRSAAARALKSMSADGYNTIRVFINAITEGGMFGTSLNSPSSAYLSNIISFLKLAKQHNLYVILTLDGFSMTPPATLLEPVWGHDYQSTNFQILSPEGVRANRTMFAVLAGELKRRGAPMESILAYELRNELTFEPELPPLSLPGGIVHTANGSTYNLSSSSEKERMLDEGLVYWIDHVRSAILQVDPTALVTVGLIPPAKPNPMRLGEKRLSVTAGAIRRSTADFIDLHIYPQPDGMMMKEFAENFDMIGVQNKPIVIGELGALMAAYPSAEDAAESMVSWQAASCGYGVQGWLLWAWDSYQGCDVWTALDSSNVIGNALSPKRRSGPTLAASQLIPRRNAARLARRHASRTMDGSSPDLAVDGTTHPWNSGDGPPQWIEIDLQQTESIRGIRLVVSQSPPGKTIHQVWIRGATEEYRMAHEFRGITKDFQVLHHAFNPPQKARFIKVVTVESPSWVAWREIQAIRSETR